MARILPGFVWPTVQDIDPPLARSREPARQPSIRLAATGSAYAARDAVLTDGNCDHVHVGHGVALTRQGSAPS
jgi:hypothetical protein